MNIKKETKGTIVNHIGNMLAAVVLGVIVGGVLHILFPDKRLLAIVIIIAIAFLWYIFGGRKKED